MLLTDLQNKLEQKQDALSTSLDVLKDQQKALKDNEDKVRHCLNVAFETLVNSVRGRERQLIRQVEVVTAHQKSLIDSQIAKLLHSKGAVVAVQNILQKHKLEDIEGLSKVVEGNIPSPNPVSPLKLASVQTDVNAMASSVTSFGKVHLPDSIAHHQSAVIPAKMEDYGDSEHDVLHKSINGRDLDNTCSIKVQFPKLPTKAWLAAPPEKPRPDRKISEDVSSWLSSLRVSPKEASKEGLSLEEDFFSFEEDLLLHPKVNLKSRTSSFSSIEVVHYPFDKESDILQTEDDGSSLKSRWLIVGPSSPCHITVPHSPAPPPKGPPSFAIEEFACQANEPCDSYDQCLCDGYCERLANERASQSSRWLAKGALPASQTMPQPEKAPAEGRLAFLDHMAQILSSPPDRWLSKRPSAKGPDNAPHPYVTYRPRSTETWLPTRVETKKAPSTLCPPFDSKVWLTPSHQQGPSPDSDTSSEYPVSVSDLKGALAELAVLVPQYSPPAGRGAPIDPSTAPNSLHDFQRRLKWLSGPHSKAPVPGHANAVPRVAPFLPESLLSLAEHNLDKWLADRL